MTDYRVCTRCVMDTSDPEIAFDDSGVCNHCGHFDRVVRHRWHRGEEGRVRWEGILRRIREEGRGRKYDSVLGLSGGVDSSYLAVRALEWGLRPLVVHVDAGWNAELAVANIERIVRHCDYDLHTIVIDWEEMRDVQLAFLRAGVANQDVPQDHAFFASLYRFAARHGLRYVLSGGNIATESILPSAWQGSAMDGENLRAIHRRFGSGKLRHFPVMTFWHYYVYYPAVVGLRVLRPLNYCDYQKMDAVRRLQGELGWRDYGRKHGESLFTRFFQNYFLPTRFGYDKRRPHLASLILAGQMSREDALTALDEPLYRPVELRTDMEYVMRKLRVTESEFMGFLQMKRTSHLEFPNWERKLKVARQLAGGVERRLNISLKVYS